MMKHDDINWHEIDTFVVNDLLESLKRGISQVCDILHTLPQDKLDVYKQVDIELDHMYAAAAELPLFYPHMAEWPVVNAWGEVDINRRISVLMHWLTSAMKVFGLINDPAPEPTVEEGFETRAVSLAEAVRYGWFKSKGVSNWRYLKSIIDINILRADQQSPRRWRFDIREVDKSAMEDAAMD